MDPATLGSGEIDPATLGSDETDPATLGSGETDPATLGVGRHGAHGLRVGRDRLTCLEPSREASVGANFLVPRLKCVSASLQVRQCRTTQDSKGYSELKTILAVNLRILVVV